MSKFSFSTKLVHAGERREQIKGQSVSAPIYPTSTYTYDSMAEMDAVFAGKSGDYIYSRHGNPTVNALENALAEIEEGKFAFAYSSGMAAIHAGLAACNLTSDAKVLASQDLYGATFALLEKIFGETGLKIETADFNDLDDVAKKVKKIKPKVLMAETISNPLLKVCDLEKIAEIAHTGGSKLIVDNTFASPFLCCPLTFGVDFSVHSATKYLGGHGDAMGGIVITNNQKDAKKLYSVLKLVGGVLSAWEAHQILRGVKTLGLRMERQCENAEMLAEKLARHKKIKKVFYPKLTGDENLNGRMLKNNFGGALVSIVLAKDTQAAAWRFMDALELCVRATSLGDVYTLVSHSASSSHREFSKERRRELGIADSLVRISVGIEDVRDIYEDIEQALEKV